MRSFGRSASFPAGRGGLARDLGAALRAEALRADTAALQAADAAERGGLRAALLDVKNDLLANGPGRRMTLWTVTRKCRLFGLNHGAGPVAHLARPGDQTAR